MMDALLIFVCSVIGLAVVAAIYLLIRSKELMEAHNEPEAPYKVEPPKSTEQLAVSEQPRKRGRPVGSKNKKRRYTKRSTYWNQFRKNAAAAKARRKYTKRSKYWKSEETQEKLKKARASAGY